MGRRGVVSAFGRRAGPSPSSTSPTSLEFQTQLGTSSNLSQSIIQQISTYQIPDSLIEFVSLQNSTVEPPRKRRRIIPEQNGSDHTSSSPTNEVSGNKVEQEYIVVKQTKWEIKFAGLKLSRYKTSLERENITPIVRWTNYGQPDHFQIVDDHGHSVYTANLPVEESTDLYLALLVDVESKKWSKESKLWTEFGLSLSHQDGSDILKITLTVLWNTTSSPYQISQPGGRNQASGKTRALTEILKYYFPDPNASPAEQWSPQDFYQSVHVPEKNDKISASLDVSEVESDLYPFQKRAVRWLLQREGVDFLDGKVRDLPNLDDMQLPNSFIPAVDAIGRPCYVSHLFGIATLDIAPFKHAEQALRGGILAEEMGLGKTVEMISLITLHKRPDADSSQVFDFFTNSTVRSTSATLIISPPSILQQWISEINRHAPHLKVKHYQGIKAHKNVDFTELVDELASSDIVISTYSVLAAEIHFTQLNPEKQLRRQPKYPRPKSPLMLLSWWRCVIDEAQMIESGVSNAAVVARMIPRMNAWCVTGTPVRRDVNDLLGLLVFLRYEPYASIKHIWSSLITSQKAYFRRVFGYLALRHSKQSVRDELRLPAQRRYVITMPFTPIEEQHYQELFKQMCTALRVDESGAPLIDGWDSEEFAEDMRGWLIRLRQESLNPGVMSRNKRIAGQKDGPLRTVDEVLDAMMEQVDVSIRTEQRALLTTKLKRGQLFENSPKVQKALDIWIEAVNEVSIIVEECREQLRKEMESGAKDGPSLSEQGVLEGGAESDSADEQEDIDPTSRIGVYRNRLRGALEIEHMAVFFRANAYFQIKSNEDLTKPGTPEFQAMEKLETEGYENAKQLRREILQEIYRKADKLMVRLSKRSATQDFVQIPAFESDLPKGGLESRGIIERLDVLAIALDDQANILDEWRERTVQSLLRSLVDEDEEGLEITGEEYEESTKTQDEVMAYVLALRTVIADRHDALTGQENQLVEFEVKSTLRTEKDGEGAFSKKVIELLRIRQLLKPTKPMGSMRGVVGELRALATSLRPDAQNGSSRAQNELSIVEKQLSIAQKQLSAQTKTTATLEKEVEFFTSIMNTRLEYYRQLQQVSDMVAPYEGPNDDAVLAKMIDEETKLASKIATSKSKRRYLEHLRKEAANPEEQRMCVICRETFEVGALTVCGHQYCRECIRMWWSAHHNCPVCKRKLIQADLHEITYKPQELTIHAEEVREISKEHSSTSSRKSTIYSEISKTKLAEIKNIELDGPSFTTKIDTLARHLIWLRESDPGAKSIIYSQFQGFLDVLAGAFSRFRIGFSSIDKSNGIEKFKEDPGIECFLLHAKAHSSGLNLVNASHVFLCEPLLNTALELQAIARVDRIGQTQETNVWLYLVDGTVEESIHQLSVKRRMEHIGQRLSNGKGKIRELTAEELLDTKLEEANSMELQEASLAHLMAKGRSGEIVQQDDLWECLFGGAKQKESSILALGNSNLISDPEVGRFLRAEAAEERQTIT